MPRDHRTIEVAGDVAPGDEAPPGTAGTGEDVCPECDGTGRIVGGIGGA